MMCITSIDKREGLHKPIVSGRDLIAAGIALPGPQLGRLLAAVRERTGAVASLVARELVQA